MCGNNKHKKSVLAVDVIFPVSHSVLKCRHHWTHVQNNTAKPNTTLEPWEKVLWVVGKKALKKGERECMWGYFTMLSIDGLYNIEI
jgi:hypothetical protein